MPMLGWFGFARAEHANARVIEVASTPCARHRQSQDVQLQPIPVALFVACGPRKPCDIGQPILHVTSGAFLALSLQA